MKLSLLFIVMDLFTILAYPFVYIHGKLLEASKARASLQLANMSLTPSLAPDK